MTATLGDMTLEDAAKRAAGNWQEFSCFCWHRQRDLHDAEIWAIFYTHHRDSGLLDQSNASAIERTLTPFTQDDNPDVVFETHDHWAVGHLDGFSVRVYRDGEINLAFKTYHELRERLADYPILDEEDYSNREFEASLENIRNVAWRLKTDYALTDGYEIELYSWLADNNPRAIENVDDDGGCPSEEELETAIKSLGFTRNS
jgi:hypothetical protein